MADCVFCKIAGGEIPSKFVYEDEKCVIFNDIHPKAKTHMLIVPRKHIPSIADMEDGDEKIAGHLLHCAKNIADNMKLKGYKLSINVGKEGGQEVFHLHVHLMSD
ncbi:histidine triad nucleotide-binding protein [Candidatus Peregrinibacteria bacterium]|nr:histidine triad nucleotide-binding protein [Candidatus Peregrinibacteria bacterium]